VFHLDDYALREHELDLLQSGAQVEPDGLIWFPGTKWATEREGFNCCELLIQWTATEVFGVQRLRFGSAKPRTRAAWRKFIDARAYVSVQARFNAIRAIFPAERVRFVVLGYRLCNVKFWNPTNSRRIDAPAECKVFPDAADDLPT
jgi:hypothetical protein